MNNLNSDVDMPRAIVNFVVFEDRLSLSLKGEKLDGRRLLLPSGEFRVPALVGMELVSSPLDDPR